MLLLVMLVSNIASWISYSVTGRPIELRTYKSGKLDFFDNLKYYLREQADKVQRCPYPGGYFLNGSCYYLSNTIHKLKPSSLKKSPEKTCSAINGTVAIVTDYNDMIKMTEWIRNTTLQTEDNFMGSPQVQGKFMMALNLIEGKLFWVNENEKIRVDKYDSLKFVYSYDRGIRLKCPALDIPLDKKEEPMFVTVNCAQKLPVICKTMVNPCFKNPCGSGKCVGVLNKYKCICPLFRSGTHCEKYSRDAIQTLISLALITVGVSVIVLKELQHFQERLKHNRTRKLISSSSLPANNNASSTDFSNRSMTLTQANSAVSQLCKKYIDQQLQHNKCMEAMLLTQQTNNSNRYQTDTSTTTIEIHTEPATSVEKCSNYTLTSMRSSREGYTSNKTSICDRLLLLVNLSFIILSTILVTFANLYIYFSRSIASTTLERKLLLSIATNDTEFNGFHRELDKFENRTICRLFNTHLLDRLYRIPASKFTIPCFVILTSLTVIFSRRRAHSWICGGYISMPTVYNPFSKTNRFESASVFGILAIEVVHIFDEFIFNAANYVTYGPLLDLFKQTGLVILIGARYFPILAAFELNPPSSVCFGLSAIYVWMEIYFKSALDAYCPPKMSQHISPRKLNLIASSYITHNQSSFPFTNATNPNERLELINVWNVLWLSHESIKLNILKQLPYYLFSSFLACRLTFRFIVCLFRQISRSRFFRLFGPKGHNPRFEDNGGQQINYRFGKNEILIKRFKWNETSFANELAYVRKLFESQNAFRKNKSSGSTQFLMSILRSIYPWKSHFTFSKQVTNVYVIAFTLVYYFTFWTLENSQRIVTYAFKLIQLGLLYTFSQNPSSSGTDLTTLDSLRANAQSRIIHDLRVISLVTAGFCVIQLVVGIKRYQKQMLSAYKGKYDTIPPRRRFRNTTIVSKAMHYPGYMIGYLIWGYLFLLVISFTIYVLFKNVVRMVDIAEALARWLIPMLVLLLLKLVLIKILSKTIFTIDNGRSLALNNTKFLYVFNYFNFFFDCFLGLLMCISRVSQASIAAILLLSRLDQSMFGRGLERFDKGFTAYACWIHLETVQTHPVLIIFCEIVRMKIIVRRMIVSKLLMSYSVNASDKDNLQLEIGRYAARQRICFKYSLLALLAKNPWLVRMRKHRLVTTTKSQGLFGRTIGGTLSKLMNVNYC